MKHALFLVIFILVGCGKNADSAPLPGPADEKLVRQVDANCGLIDACEGLEAISLDQEFKCARQKVSSSGWIDPWKGVDYGENACYTTYRLQQKDPSCDPASPNQVCSGLFGNYPCCHYEDIPGKTLEEILPVKDGCSSPTSCG